MISIFVIAIIILIAIFVYTAIIAYPLFTMLILNIPILYLAYLIAYGDLIHTKRYYEYIIGLLFGAVIFIFANKFFAGLPFWEATSFVVLVILIAKLAFHTKVHALFEDHILTGKKESGLKKVEYGSLKKI